MATAYSRTTAGRTLMRVCPLSSVAIRSKGTMTLSAVNIFGEMLMRKLQCKKRKKDWTPAQRRRTQPEAMPRFTRKVGRGRPQRGAAPFAIVHICKIGRAHV